VEIDPRLAEAYTNLGARPAPRARAAAIAAIAARSRPLCAAPGADARGARGHAVLRRARWPWARGAGIALQDLGDAEGAVRATRTAVELKPALGAAQNNYGRALENTQDLEGALAAYRAALSAAGTGYAEAFCAQAPAAPAPAPGPLAMPC
jgi:tetratricopeptide (TPR) repeat protein